MAKDMTEDFSLVFTPGSIISCITCFDHEYEGEVVAFDYDRRLLIIKSQSPDDVNHHNVHVLNLNYVRNNTIEIKKEVKKESMPQNNYNINTQKVRACQVYLSLREFFHHNSLSRHWFIWCTWIAVVYFTINWHLFVLSLLLTQLDQRASEAIRERVGIRNAFKSGVSEHGLKLYLMLSKMLGNQVSWSDRNIQVEPSTTITPPYKPENCTPRANADHNIKTTNYVQMQVTRYWSEQSTASQNQRQT